MKVLKVIGSILVVSVIGVSLLAGCDGGKKEDGGVKPTQENSEGIVYDTNSEVKVELPEDNK